MNHAISVDASERRQFLELWTKYQLHTPALGLSIAVDPPMAGPDARNLVTFYDVPSDFLPVLTASCLDYQSEA
ncbi:MAG TPA: hypothetical protein VK522_22495 [Pseudolabrys sp.]|nr:hypothetical protein [Pseudolabrys sp.]